jgi:hypothetical protein
VNAANAIGAEPLWGATELPTSLMYKFSRHARSDGDDPLSRHHIKIWAVPIYGAAQTFCRLTGWRPGTARNKNLESRYPALTCFGCEMRILKKGIFENLKLKSKNLKLNDRKHKKPLKIVQGFYFGIF